MEYMDYAQYALTIVGAIYAVILGLEKIAKITPNTKDDFFVGKAKRFFGTVSDILSKLILKK